MNIRQILALVLALVMCVLMCACSNDSEDNDESTGTSSKYKKYAKYADLFELLEDEDYAGAIQAIIAMKNESEKEDENQEGNEVNKKFSQIYFSHLFFHIIPYGGEKARKRTTRSGSSFLAWMISGSFRRSDGHCRSRGHRRCDLHRGDGRDGCTGHWS